MGSSIPRVVGRQGDRPLPVVVPGRVCGSEEKQRPSQHGQCPRLCLSARFGCSVYLGCHLRMSSPLLSVPKPHDRL